MVAMELLASTAVTVLLIVQENATDLMLKTSAEFAMEMVPPVLQGFAMKG